MYNRPVGSLVLLQIRTSERSENPRGQVIMCWVQFTPLVDIGLTDLLKTTSAFPALSAPADLQTVHALFCITPLAPTVLPTVVIFYEQDKRNGDVR